MSRSNVNLHAHTVYSDGSKTVAEVVDALRSAGIDTFSITDHDTVAGNTEAAELARQLGMRYIKGVEISCIYNGEGGLYDNYHCHILGYGFDSDKMREALKTLRAYVAYPTIQEGIKLVQDCGGLAVWAHPFHPIYRHLITLPNAKLKQIAKAMESYGLDGIEAYYQMSHPAHIAFKCELAKQYGWLKTAATDYHGDGPLSYLSFDKEGITADVTLLDKL